MSRIVEYKIVSASNVENLEGEVSAYLEEGWQPMGGIAIDAHPMGSSHPYASQVIVKYASSDAPDVIDLIKSGALHPDD